MSGESFRDRLRRVRRDSEEAGERVASVREQLALRRPASLDAPRTGERAGAPSAWAPVTGLCESSAPEGRIAARSTRFDRGQAHGAFRLAEVDSIDRAFVALTASDRSLADVDFSRALYFDTETTGLSGGAGTYVFLVGLGSFDERGFDLWQGFLPHPAEERALLAEVARRMRASSAIVSFFGKSFDRHRLEDRMRVHGIDPPFRDVCHLDLYHPLQRLYRGALADGRLATLEAALCGVQRARDLSGAFAPAAWFDFLAGRPHELEGVLAHNRDDVLSLVTLLAHLGRSQDEQRAAGEPLDGPADARAHGIAKLLARAGRHVEAESWFDRAWRRAEDRAAAAGTIRRLRLAHAQCLVRCGACERALAALLALTDEPEDECSAHAWALRGEMCERFSGDARAGLEACHAALRAIERWHTGAERARLERSCRARRRRLERKLRLSSAARGART